MDNQQAKFAYIAGLIDGEGCLDFNINRRNGIDRYVPRIRIAMTCFRTLEKLKELISSTGLPFWTEEKRRDPQNKRWSPSWCLTINGIRRINKWVDQISPYSITKHDEMEILSKYVKSRLNNNPTLGNHTTYTDYEKKLVAELKKCKMPQRLNAEHQ